MNVFKIHNIIRAPHALTATVRPPVMAQTHIHSLIILNERVKDVGRHVEPAEVQCVHWEETHLGRAAVTFHVRLISTQSQRLDGSLSCKLIFVLSMKFSHTLQ